MTTLPIHHPRPSMLMRTSASRSRLVKAKLVNWADSTGRRNTIKLEVAMGIRRQGADRCGRPPLRSLGRPSVAGRDERQLFWTFIAKGMSGEAAAIKAGISQPVGTRQQYYRQFSLLIASRM